MTAAQDRLSGGQLHGRWRTRAESSLRTSPPAARFGTFESPHEPIPHTQVHQKNEYLFWQLAAAGIYLPPRDQSPG
jgi:hypothetical protein